MADRKARNAQPNRNGEQPENESPEYILHYLLVDNIANTVYSHPYSTESTEKASKFSPLRKTKRTMT